MNDTTLTSTDSHLNLNLTEVLEDIFLVLSDKERDVIIRRFSLDNGPKQTLEKIGQHFSVTRERIRQIEKIALNKLRRTVSNTKLRLVNDVARKIIEQNGGVMLEDEIVNEIVKLMHPANDINKHIIRLALYIDKDLVKREKSAMFRPFWRISAISLDFVKSVIKESIVYIGRQQDIVEAQVITKFLQGLSPSFAELSIPFVRSVLTVDHRVKEVKKGVFGLMKWRHINPKSIRDKAYIILKNGKDPLHFVDIANKIGESGFDKKVVTTQAVHNELIRCDLFVLVGRGLYALKEWGFKSGTVADIIFDLLKKKSPMTKKEIMQGVLKQRQVKKGTISLNLQKVEAFERVGRAVYSLNEAKWQK